MYFVQMYVQPQFHESRLPVLHELIRQHPLATFIVHRDEIVVNHFPLLVEDTGEFGVLKGHIPKSNDLCEALESGEPAIAVFQGPEAYITPSWYPSKHKHGKAVPTWNYAVVHAHGIPVAVHDADWLYEHLNQLTNQHEAQRPVPWQVADAPANFTKVMLDAIVGIEMPITSLVGKWKVSQNKSLADKKGIAAGLRARGSNDDLALERMLTDTVDNSPTK